MTQEGGQLGRDKARLGARPLRDSRTWDSGEWPRASGRLRGPCMGGSGCGRRGGWRPGGRHPGADLMSTRPSCCACRALGSLRGPSGRRGEGSPGEGASSQSSGWTAWPVPSLSRPNMATCLQPPRGGPGLMGQEGAVTGQWGRTGLASGHGRRPWARVLFAECGRSCGRDSESQLSHWSGTQACMVAPGQQPARASPGHPVILRPRWCWGAGAAATCGPRRHGHHSGWIRPHPLLPH